MNKQELIKYLNITPYNTNTNVIASILDNYDKEDGDSLIKKLIEGRLSEKFVVPSDVTTITDGVFIHSGAKEIDMSKCYNLESIFGAFGSFGTNDSTITTIKLPKNGRGYSISGNFLGTFNGCDKLTELDLTGCTRLSSASSNGEQAAVFGNSGITIIYLSTKMQQFGWNVFSQKNAPNLTDIYYSGTEEQWNNIGNNNNCGLHEGITIHYNWMPNEE